MNTKALTPRERYVYGQLLRNGYQIYRGGWPDFMVVKEGKVRFIEVKATHDSVSKAQKRMHKAFRSFLKIEVNVVRLDERWSY